MEYLIAAIILLTLILGIVFTIALAVIAILFFCIKK